MTYLFFTILKILLQWIIICVWLFWQKNNFLEPSPFALGKLCQLIISINSFYKSFTNAPVATWIAQKTPPNKKIAQIDLSEIYLSWSNLIKLAKFPKTYLSCSNLPPTIPPKISHLPSPPHILKSKPHILISRAHFFWSKWYVAEN